MRTPVTEVTYGEGVRKEENSKCRMPKGHQLELFYRRGSHTGQMGLALRGTGKMGCECVVIAHLWWLELLGSLVRYGSPKNIDKKGKRLAYQTS